MPTWKATVPDEAERLPGELMWWCGLAAVPAAVWFSVVALRGNTRVFLKPLISLIVALVVFLPLALHGCGDWLPLKEPWDGRWRMAEVFLSLAVLMGCIGGFFKTGLRAGQQPAIVPALLTAGTAIMWLLGRSYFLRERLEAGGYDQAWLSLAGKTLMMEILVPMPFLVMLALAVAMSIFLNATIYGRYFRRSCARCRRDEPAAELDRPAGDSVNLGVHHHRRRAPRRSHCRRDGQAHGRPAEKGYGGCRHVMSRQIRSSVSSQRATDCNS
jgi:hypothetical protein